MIYFIIIILFWGFAVLVLLLVQTLCGWCRRLLGVCASAPASVFFNILFIWGFYTAVVRQGACIFSSCALKGLTHAHCTRVHKMAHKWFIFFGEIHTSSWQLYYSWLSSFSHSCKLEIKNKNKKKILKSS